MSSNRAWWQIPLWSPWHFACACVLVLLTVFIAGRASGGSDAAASPEPPVSSTPSPAATTDPAEEAVSATTVTSKHRTTTSSAVAAVDPEDVADRFVDVWVRRYDPANKWRAAVIPLSTPAFAELLGATDPLQVPASRSFGDAKAITTGKSSSVVRVGTDAGPVKVSLQRTGTKWLVDGIEPIEEGR